MTRAVVPHMRVGITTVGTTAVQVTTLELPEGPYRGILIKAPGANDGNANTAPIYVGGANVTANQASTGGFPLAPGQSLEIPLERIEQIYLISSSASQIVNWIMV